MDQNSYQCREPIAARAKAPGLAAAVL